MSAAFHEILGQLRKQRGISQRKVAEDLFISQALLSHYENGIREPGLDFVSRTCTYYGVTADYLLGRDEADLAEGLGAKNTDPGLDARALVIFLQNIHQLGSEALYAATLQCFGAVSYRLMRHMSHQGSEQIALAVPENQVAAVASAAHARGEMRFIDSLEQLDHEKGAVPEQLAGLLKVLDKQTAAQAKGGSNET